MLMNIITSVVVGHPCLEGRPVCKECPWKSMLSEGRESERQLAETVSRSRMRVPALSAMIPRSARLRLSKTLAALNLFPRCQ